MNALKWLGTTVMLSTGALTAFNIYPINLMVGSVACMILGYVAVKQKEWQYALINATFLSLNAVGLTIHYF